MYQQCISLLRNQDKSAYYCLTLKLWNEPCAKRCQNKVMGKIGKLEEVEIHGFDINCLDMNRKASSDTKDKNLSFFCAIYKLHEPFCKECSFARYVVELVGEIDLSP